MSTQKTLRGRDAECMALDRFLDAVRAGDSQILVLRGEPGVGKSALLDYVADRASGCRLLRAAGVEYETELAYAGVHQLCGSVLDLRERLPGPQRDALATAFGLSAGPAPDRFVVALAVLGLLAEVAEGEPLVCVVDDVQWLDTASLVALAFVARRLLAESIGLIFAVREPSDVAELTGFEDLQVGGLDDDDARALLESAVPGRLDERVRDRAVAECRGNPLALLELPRGLSPGKLAGGFGLPDVPLASRIEQSFLRRLEPLPAETRRLLLIAAAEPYGDASLLWRAAERLGLRPDAAGPAETAGLVQVGALVRFRHPLVRSAVYRAAALSERQEVHRVLAESIDADIEPDRRAWHRGLAATGPDEDIATDLERSAERAQGRGGLAAAAAFLARATELTPDPARRAERAFHAAYAKHQAGAFDPAAALLAIAEAGPLDEFRVALAHLLQAEIAFAQNRGGDVPPLLLAAARRLERIDVSVARETYLGAIGAAMLAGHLSHGPTLREVAEAARAAPSVEQPRLPDRLLDALVVRFTDGLAASVPILQRVVQVLLEEGMSGQGALRALWLASVVPLELLDHEGWYVLTSRLVSTVREAGALGELPLALDAFVTARIFAGELDAAASLLEEARTVSEATQSRLVPYGTLALAAFRGREREARPLIDSILTENATRGEGLSVSWAHCANAMLDNGLGKYADALTAAQEAARHQEYPTVPRWALVELVEAAARCNATELGAGALERLSEATQACGTDWSLGVEARARALLSGTDAAEDLYREAIERLGRTRVRIELARAHLVYGEWLRREQRRMDAREELRTAYDMFAEMGVEAFGERARRELLATGGTVVRRAEKRSELTPQEAQIAQLAREGLSNPEIGARLFISPRTAQYHLRKVFLKLDITSRNELSRVPESRLTLS